MENNETQNDQTSDSQPQKDQPKSSKKAKADDVELVEMFKDGTSLGVHPTCVDSHVLAGWKLK
jgi:hypothetical protein